MRLTIKRIWGRLPEDLKLGHTYRATRKFLSESASWSQGDWNQYRVQRLRSILTHAEAHVPFYTETFAQAQFCPSELTDVSQLASLPLVDKAQMRATPALFTAQAPTTSGWMELSTGGSTGEPHTFPYPRDRYNSEYAFMFGIWARVGFKPGERLIMLRGQALPEERLFEFDPRWNARVFSAQHIRPENLSDYLDAMSEFDARYLLAYPSALIWMYRLLQESGMRPPKFKAILLGSEGASAHERRFLESFGQIPVLSWYGHTERLVLGGECEFSDAYHEEPGYGLLELVDGSGQVITKPGISGEMVGTTFDNTAFPFIRFKTGDWAEWSMGSCACGRPHRRFTNVSGRVHAEHLVGQDGSFFSPTALNRHGSEYKRIHRYQYLQTVAGEVTVRIVPAAGFTSTDSDLLLQSLKDASGSRIKWAFELVDHIHPGPGGKHRIVDRKIPAASAFMEHSG